MTVDAMGDSLALDERKLRVQAFRQVGRLCFKFYESFAQKFLIPTAYTPKL